MSTDGQVRSMSARYGSVFAMRSPTGYPIIAWAVLTITLLVTWFAYDVSQRTIAERIDERFRFQTDDIRSAIAKRMLDQEIGLRGGLGLFAASRNVKADEWRAYVESLDIAANFPGLQGFGYAKLVTPQTVDAFSEELQALGDFELRPEGVRPAYVPVTWLEPLDWRNRRAMGFDMYSEPVRREAMQRARDTGAPAATGVVTLVQENGTDVQRGFLLYLPIYRQQAPVDTQEQRRAALTGFVYSPFRANDLMRGILGARDSDIHFEIYDGGAVRPEALLYRSTTLANQPHDTQHELERTVSVQFAGRQWTLVFCALPGYSTIAERYQPALIGVGGLLISILVFFAISTAVRQRSVAELRASEFSDESRSQSIRNRAIVNTVRDGIITVSADFTIQTCNSSTGSIFGHGVDELIGKSFAPMTSDDTAARLVTALDTDDGNQSLYFGLSEGMVGIRKNGTAFPMEVSITPMRVDGGTLFTIVVRDLTEQQRTERLKSEFISVVSHELRTPLTALQGSLSLMHSGVLGRIPDEASGALSIANANAKRLINLVSDIIDQERMKSGQYSVVLEPSDVVAVVRGAVARNEAYAANQDITINLDIFAKQIFAMADPERLAQVLDNLISNAIKFTPGGEAVDVCVLEESGSVRIEIHDLGPGIAEDMQQRIFEPFFQVETSNNRNNSGAGLGLAIAKTILEMHNTAIRVHSQPGIGTCMWFELRKTQPVARALTPPVTTALLDA